MANTSINQDSCSTRRQDKLAFGQTYLDIAPKTSAKSHEFGVESQNSQKDLMYTGDMTRGERIVKKREERSWNRRKLADLSGVGYDRLNKLEHDKTKEPRGQTLALIAKTLGVSVEYLETGEETPPTMDADELHFAMQANPEGVNGLLAKQAWEAAEAIEERVYGKQGGGMDFLLETYERILKRMINDKDEAK
ncbi:hypothetical protein GCM10007094_23440 [Pseudovibrio japonicus]|uniref:HTH cro/C1-type domain-containing protein n=1 Tax=Pseudovibrio japonicus TaxID=366534 RepID=A0ABQ3ED11_9HYPH|nr:helix-turn-helix transcriptional regulator [Pseudovibrio japonicus]GHB33854.1 hypothetical protein GCM10007094_23440 [Pseudovibrio japonicus]